MKSFGWGLRAIARLSLPLVCALLAACGGGGDGDGGTNNTQPAGGIGPAGGTVTEASGAQAVIPAGALTSNVNIEVTQSSAGAPSLPSDVTAVGPMYAFTPHGTAFAAAVTVTVPFDSASVPSGASLKLIKTSAGMTGWEDVAGATVAGAAMTGQVTGFSVFVVVRPQQVLDLSEREWTLKEFAVNGHETILDHDTVAGEIVNRAIRYGGNLPFRPFVGLFPDARALQEAFVNENGHTYYTSTEAPAIARDASGAPIAPAVIGGESELHLTATYRKKDPDATLRITVNRAFLHAIDDGGAAPDPVACPWDLDVPSPFDDCAQFMTYAEANFDLKAHVLLAADDFYSVGGIAWLQGMAGLWSAGASGNGDQEALWSDEAFDKDLDVSRTGGVEAEFELIGPILIDVPLNDVGVDQVFNIDVRELTHAANVIQGESYISAFLRDPQQAQGLEVSFTGLEELPVQHDVRPDPQPQACTTEPDPEAGTVQFTAPDFRFPERPQGAQIVVERVGGTRGDITVLLESSDGTATAGSDYPSVHQLIQFKDGHGGPRTLKVPLLFDDVEEPNETANLKLSVFRGCAALGAQKTATLTILDDDRVVPPPDTFTVGGTISGLTGSDLVIKDLISGTTVQPTGNGKFSVLTVPDLTPYNVVIDTQPTDQGCTLTNGVGTVTHANVANIVVTCTSATPVGGLDPDFGSGGKVTTAIAFSPVTVGTRIGLALQPDGKILLVGGTTLIRFNANGQIDDGFGQHGILTVSFGGGTFDTAQDVVAQPDGKIVVIGFAASFTPGSDDFAVARYNADGSPDSNFGTGGRTRTDFFGSTDQARRVRLLADGRILLIGSTTQIASPTVATTEFALMRYNADGSPDTTFGNAGKVADSPGAGFSQGRAIALQSDGKFIAAGSGAVDGVSDPDVGIIRFFGDNFGLPGRRDDTFGPLHKGFVLSDLGLATGYEEAMDAVVTADDSIMTASRLRIGSAASGGGPNFQFALSHFSKEGDLVSGSVLSSFSNDSDVPKALLLQADGKLVMVGQSANLGANPDMAIARYNANTTLDSTFGTGGKLAVDFSGGIDGAEAVVQQPDGKLIVGGFAQQGNARGLFALARILP
ncbi:MAG TPA: Calx-beta domain-containing protein [Steroidobacteraceae bacterium]|jgi:uncharacterized delta-60 repeat protein